MPRAGHKSRPTAATASWSAWSSSSNPAAAIQFADSTTRDKSPMGAAARFVRASATAMRAAAAGSITANGDRSPIANASPAKPS